jgi:hypothetical protein
VDSSSSDEAGASIGKNLHKGKSPQATYLEAFDKQKVMQNDVLIILFIDSLSYLIY